MLILLRHIAVFTAFGILLLHSVIPHQHHKSSYDTVVAQTETSDILNLLEDFFQHNEGDSNLENIHAGCANSIVENQDIFILYSFFITPEIIIERIETENHFVTSSYSGFEISASAHRGPPQLG